MADFDVLVIGSGFGGSVTALRLSEKGYRVGVLEAGRRFADGELPKNSWHVRDFLWAPKLGCTGIQRIHVLKDSVILAGAGVGNGGEATAAAGGVLLSGAGARARFCPCAGLTCGIGTGSRGAATMRGGWRG